MAARGRCSSAFRSKSSNDMHRSPRLQSTNCTEAPAGPARERDGAQAVPGRPSRLEAARHIALGPLLGGDDLVPQRMQPLAVALVESDPERGKRRLKRRTRVKSLCQSGATLAMGRVEN